MFTLDQAIDPLRDFFMPFSFPKQRESQGDASVKGCTRPGAAAQSDGIPTFVSIPKPILVLLISLISNAVMFSVVAGLALLVFYVFREMSVPFSPLIRVLFSGILVADLFLLLLSVSKIVFVALRDV
jgi:type IV secretory pathway VirB3-like protein